jgi:MFS family permease
MIGLAFWATAINYLDRQTLSVAAPALSEQFHMSDVAYSRVTTAFLLAYTIMNGVSGPLIDRLGTRLGYGLCVLWWSLSAMLHAFSRGAFSLGAFRFLLGIGEAGNWPGAVKVVAEWFPENERALASGVFNSGSAAGAILAPPIVALLLLKLGWQSAFVFVGITGLIWLVFWWKMYYTPERPADAPPEKPIPVARLIRSRFVVAFTISKIFLDPVWYFYIFWFPKYLKTVRHFDLATIGKVAWIPFLVAGFGNILGGMMSSALLKRGASVTGGAEVRRDVLRGADAERHPGGPGDGDVAGDRVRLDRHAGLHGSAGEYADDSVGRFPEERGRFGLWLGEHGVGVWRDALHADHRPGSRAVVVYAGVHRLRNSAADLREYSVGVRGSAAAGEDRVTPSRYDEVWLPSIGRSARQWRAFPANSVAHGCCVALVCQCRQFLRTCMRARTSTTSWSGTTGWIATK